MIRTRFPRLWRLAVPLVSGLAVTAVPGAAQGQDNRYGNSVSDEIITTTQQDGEWVALTFDDGPDPVHTPALLAVLERHHVKATFCLWGDHVKRHPEIVRDIRNAGHRLCNHTMHHDNMSSWAPEQIRPDLLATSAAIRDAAPGAHIPYFRAPYGAWGQTPQVAAQLGMQPLGWKTLIVDWEPPGADILTQRLLDAAQPGAVILMHDAPGDRGQTVTAVDRAIPVLKERGFRFGWPDNARGN